MTFNRKEHFESIRNTKGRPKVQSKPVSPLRKTLTKLRALEEQALENIAAVVNGTKTKNLSDNKEVVIDKDRVEISKWIISTISSMSRAASSEEELRHNIRSRAEDKAERELERELPKEATTDNVVRGRFTTDFVEDEE